MKIFQSLLSASNHGSKWIEDSVKMLEKHCQSANLMTTALAAESGDVVRNGIALMEFIASCDISFQTTREFVNQSSSPKGVDDITLLSANYQGIRDSIELHNLGDLESLQGKLAAMVYRHCAHQKQLIFPSLLMTPAILRSLAVTS